MYIENILKAKSSYLTILFFVLVSPSHAQDFTEYIYKAWQNNNQLKQKEFQLAAAESQYNESKSLYMPSLGFGVNYTLAQGGRNIELPVGDLLNPVYSTLNFLTQTNHFPQIENVEEQFLPNNFYDAKFRITQPIFHPDIAIQKRYTKTSTLLRATEIKAFKRLISKDVMHNLISLLLQNEIIHIYKSTDTLLQESLRATKSMVQNGIALPSSIKRIENQLALNQSNLIEANTSYSNLMLQYQFLTGNQDTFNVNNLSLQGLPTIDNIPKPREELTQLTLSKELSELQLNKENNFYKPKIGAQIDLGSQAFEFGFNPYYLIGINAEISLFDGNRVRNRKNTAKANFQAMQSQLLHVTDQLELQVKVSLQNMNTSIKQFETFEVRAISAEKIWNETTLRYKSGSANYLELLDAQTQLTFIKTQQAIAKYSTWLRWADYYYNAALLDIE